MHLSTELTNHNHSNNSLYLHQGPIVPFIHIQSYPLIDTSQQNTPDFFKQHPPMIPWVINKNVEDTRTATEFDVFVCGFLITSRMFFLVLSAR